MGYGFGPYPGCSWGQAPVDVPIVIWQDDDPEAQLVCFEENDGYLRCPPLSLNNRGFLTFLKLDSGKAD